VEDMEENRALIIAILSSLKIPYKFAVDGKEGLEIASREEFSLFIVDLMMPIMSGGEFIRKLKERNPDSVVLVQTALDSSETIIEIMKMGVYDYIIKPIDPDVFRRILLKALEYKYLKNIETYIQTVENQKLKSQIEWLNYKESLRKSGTDSSEKSSIYNLKTSLSQGSGFGTMTTIVDMIRGSAVSANEKKALVDKELLEILYENNEITKNMLKGLANVSDLLDRKFNLTRMKGTELVSKIPEYAKDLEPFLPRKKIRINYPILRSECSIRIDEECIQIVIEELLLNAYKYSKEEENIDIFAHINNGYLVITVKNIILDDEYGGIPEYAEKLVTQPFYRIHPPDESVATIEKFGLGLGLTMVESILSKHNGLFFIHNAKDHTQESVMDCVLAEVFIPLE